MKQHHSRSLSSFCVLLASATCACNSLVGLDDFSVKDKVTVECTTNQECSDRATAANGGMPVAAVCVQTPEPHCANLLSEDCDTITGDHLEGDPIILGTLFTTAMTNPQRATNLQRQQSAQLAIEQINNVGGVPIVQAGQSRKLVLVSCDESANLSRAARHLVDDLRVPGIVGPNTSQDTLDLSNEHTIRGGTVVMTPTGVASSITGLVDDDLTWQMVPTDVQRAPLMIQQINAIETKLKTDRSLSQVKLGIVFRDDALGSGTRTALSSLAINGKPISDATVNIGKNVNIDGYDFSKPDQMAIVQKYVAFAPDIIVLAGTAEAITQVMKPLEAAWTASHRPEYVLIDSVKVPDLLTLVKDNDPLRRRIRGTGIKAGPETAAVYGSFQIDYQVAFPMMSATTSGMGPSYDAAYSLAYGLAAIQNEPVSGPAIAQGLRMLAGGTTQIEVGSQKVTQAFQRLSRGEKIKALGTFGPLEWDANGAVVGGTLEMWCIGVPSGTPAYQNSGLNFDIRTQTPSGEYTQCAP